MEKKLKTAYQNFEETFRSLLHRAQKEPVSVQTFLTILSGKGSVLLLIFLSLGFSQIPGIGIVLGIFIAYLGVCIAAGKSFIWLPGFLRRRKIGSYFLVKVTKQILHLLKFMKKWSCPRYEWATHKGTVHVLNGLVIALVGLCVASSPPIPLTGFLANVAIFLIAIGLLNDDGVYVILGYISAFLYLVLVIFLIKYCSLSQIIDWIRALFS